MGWFLRYGEDALPMLADGMCCAGDAGEPVGGSAEGPKVCRLTGLHVPRGGFVTPNLRPLFQTNEMDNSCRDVDCSGTPHRGIAHDARVAAISATSACEPQGRVLREERKV